MPFKVKITNGNEIIIDDGNTILESALDQGIDFPHGCRTGNCGACKSKKISGILNGTSNYILSRMEKTGRG